MTPKRARPSIPLTQARAAVRQMVEQQSGGRLKVRELTLRETGRYGFKRTFRFIATVADQAGHRSRLILRGNVPSRDTPDEARTANTVQRALWSAGFQSGNFLVSRPFGVIDRLKMNLYEELRGATLESAIHHSSRRAEHLALTSGRWLGQLAQLRLRVGRIRDLNQVDREAAWFEDNFRQLPASQFEESILLLESAVRAQHDIIARRKNTFRTIHGDLNLGNLVAMRGGSTGLIDFGASWIFDPHSDVGNFLAQVDHRRWRRELTPAVAERLNRSFIRGWRSRQTLDRRRVTLHRAWWTLQILSYALAIQPEIGKLTAAQALRSVRRLLESCGYQPGSPLTRTSDYAASLVNASTMRAFFSANLAAFFPSAARVETIDLRHQPALSTTSFLTRYVLKLRRPGGAIETRVVRGNRITPETLAITQRVWTGRNNFAAIRPLTYLARIGYYFYEEVPGTPFRNIPFRSVRFRQCMPLVGRALADFHKIHPTGSRRLTIDQEKQHLNHIIRSIRRYGPVPNINGLELKRLLLQNLRSFWNDKHALVHNDFQASNVIIQSSGTGIIDYTMSGVGHPAIDVANFLAHLDIMLLGVLPPKHIARLGNAFVQAYRRSAHEASTIAFQRATKFFRLRSSLDILATTVINLGPQDPNRRRYVNHLTRSINQLKQELTT